MIVCCSRRGNLLPEEPYKPESWERRAIFAFGVVFVLALSGFALQTPDPSSFQYKVAGIVMALAAAGVAALVPGFIEVKYRPLARATGAFGVLLLVAIIFFWSDAPPVKHVTLPKDTGWILGGFIARPAVNFKENPTLVP